MHIKFVVNSYICRMDKNRRMDKNLIKEFPGNPRVITEDELLRLRESLVEYGYLGGFVINVAPGKYQDCIVSGNQKSKHINLKETEIQILKKFSTPTATGTVAVGNVVFNGELFPYREVYWSEQKCEVANLLANNAGGRNDSEMLALLDPDVLEIAGVSLELEKEMQRIRDTFNYDAASDSDIDSMFTPRQPKDGGGNGESFTIVLNYTEEEYNQVKEALLKVGPNYEQAVFTLLGLDEPLETETGE